MMPCVTALCGDLFESWLKRCARLKEAGDLLSGHGGLLIGLTEFLARFWHWRLRMRLEYYCINIIIFN
jgi:predicted CDP-diglyceride synthetase/phosphatidate cytidylyltransferase